MFEDSVSSIPSIWASMNSWFTPAVLFVLLNVMIGTIAFTSTLANQKKFHHNHQQQQNQNQNRQIDPQQQPNLARSPSVLQRLRSINFYSYRSQEPQHLAAHFKPIAPDSISDAHYNIERQNHQVQLHYQTENSFETHSQYIFAHPAAVGVGDGSTAVAHREEKQPVGFYENPRETEANNYYPHQQIYQGKILENQPPHYFFEQTNEVKHQETGTAGFDFQQVLDQENTATTQENGSHFDFEQAQEEKVEKNEYHYDSEQAHEENLENDELQSLDEVYSKLAERHVSRSKSDTKPSAGEVPAKLSTKMKKSASMKSPFNHFKEDEVVEARRPATVKEKSTRRVTEADEEVDAKADDFINRFKQQLKLQRADSIIRNKEMIGRGSGGGR